MPKTPNSVPEQSRNKSTAQLAKASKKELNQAIDRGHWESVGEIAVLMSDSSFALNDDLNTTLVSIDELRDESRVVQFHDENHRPASGLDGQVDNDTGVAPEGITPKSQLNLEANKADAHSNERNITRGNRENLSTFVELEDPSGLFLSVHVPDNRLGNGRGISSLPQRWAILALTCIVMTGIYYSLDIPAALHQELKNYMPPSLKFEIRFNLLYTVYSIPNMILPFFAGKIVDRIGASQCLLGCAMLTLLGQFLFSIGTATRSWIIMLLSRTVYGFGGESSCVAYSTLLSRWFAGGEVALSFGISLAVSRLGSVLNNFVSPVVAHSASTPWALWTGVLFNSISAVMAFAILCMDQRSSRASRANNERDLAEPLLQTGGRVTSNEEVNELRGHGNAVHVHFFDVVQFGPLFWLLSISCLVIYGCVLPFNNVASGILMERNYFMQPPDDCVLEFPNQCTLGSLQNHSNPSTNANGDSCPSRNYAPILPTSLNITDSSGEPIHQFDSLSPADVDCDDSFWASACTKDYCDAQNGATEKAGRIMSIPYFMSAVLSPVLGHIVDKIGQRAIIASLASLILISVHATLGLTRLSPVLPLVGQGMAYALYAAVLWPSVPLTVEENFTGTAFGVIVSIQNIGLSLFPLAIAAIHSLNGHEYLPSVEIFFVSSAVAGLVVGILLNVLDRRHGNKLNSVAGTGDGSNVSVRSNDTDFSDVNAENIFHK